MRLQARMLPLRRPSPSASKNEKATRAVATARTPIKVAHLEAYLTGYDPIKTHYLVSGLTNGFRLESEGLTTARTNVPNPTTSRQMAEQVGKKLQKEITAGRVRGPFKSPPLSNFRVFPIKVSEKKEPGTFRFIHNLSYPYDEDSVKSG